MSKVFGEVTIPYKGKDYVFKGTFAFINRVEQRVNLAIFEQQARNGTARISDIAWIVYAALSFSGCECTYEDVGNEMMLGSSIEIAGRSVQMSEYYGTKVGELFEACFPKEETNEDPAEDESKGTKKKT